MRKAVKTPRPYNSPRRREQAEATRGQILKAAQRLFEERGYSATSVSAIAAEAGVASKTVYLAFETKSGLLRAVWHRLLRGERDEVPVGRQDWFREVMDEPDAERQIALHARNARAVKERASALMEVIREGAAGDPDVDALWERIQSDFYDNQRVFVQSLAAKGALRAGLDSKTATDILWTLNHPTLYPLLVGRRGWSADQFQAWLDGLLRSELLGLPR